MGWLEMRYCRPAATPGPTRPMAAGQDVEVPGGMGGQGWLFGSTAGGATLTSETSMPLCILAGGLDGNGGVYVSAKTRSWNVMYTWFGLPGTMGLHAVPTEGSYGTTSRYSRTNGAVVGSGL